MEVVCVEWTYMEGPNNIYIGPINCVRLISKPNEFSPTDVRWYEKIFDSILLDAYLTVV